MKKGNCVYFIGDGEFVKIGFTSNLERRLKQLQTGHKTLLRVVAIAEGATRATEKVLHRALWEHRAVGEWFRCEGAVLRVLVAVQAGKRLTSAEDIAYIAGVPARAFNKHIPEKERLCIPPGRKADKVQIRKGIPAPVPPQFVGTPAETRILELEAMRRDKSLDQRSRGRVYCELRHLVNGRYLTSR